MKTNVKQRNCVFFHSKFLFLFLIFTLFSIDVKAGNDEIEFPSMNVKLVYNGKIKEKQVTEKVGFKYTFIREKTESGSYDNGGYYTTEEYYDEDWDEYYEEYVYVPNYKSYSYTKLLERIDITYESFPTPDKDGIVLSLVKENAQNICKDIYNNLRSMSTQQNTVYSSGYSRFGMGESDLKKLSIDYEKSVINYSEMYGFRVDGADVLAHLQVSYILEKGEIIGRSIKIHTSLDTSGNSNVISAYVCSKNHNNSYTVNAPSYKLSFNLPFNFMALRYITDSTVIAVKFGRSDSNEWKGMITGNDFLIHDIGELATGDRVDNVYSALFGIQPNDDPFSKDTFWQNQLESTYNTVGKNPNINYVGYASFPKSNDSSNSGGIRFVMIQFYNHIYVLEYIDDIGPTMQFNKFIELAMILRSMKKM